MNRFSLYGSRYGKTFELASMFATMVAMNTFGQSLITGRSMEGLGRYDPLVDEGEELPKINANALHEEIEIPRYRLRRRLLRITTRFKLRELRQQFFRKLTLERPDLNRATRRALMKRVCFV